MKDTIKNYLVGWAVILACFGFVALGFFLPPLVFFCIIFGTITIILLSKMAEEIGNDIRESLKQRRLKKREAKNGSR